MSDEPPPLPRPSTAPPPPDLECPRCGYDLQGQAHGPAGPHAQHTGICSECGLAFRWDEVSDLARRRRLDIFEHAGGRLVKNFWITYRKTFAPWRFWRWMRMEHQVALDRLLIFAAIAPFVSLVMAGALVLAIRISHDLAMRYGFSVSINVFRPENYWSEGLVLPAQALLLLSTVFLPFSFALLPQSLRKARVRPRHFARSAAYSVGVPIVLAILPTAALELHNMADFAWHLQGSRLLAHWSFEWSATLSLLWQFVWWGTFARSYCRLDHPLWGGAVAERAV
ncbi:hypothetical protein PHYC_01172 [Phycisphaerales bacterium]|nr:hypothetical protein PHYC_01172 [Phycisphaerales bacterium]